MSSPVQKKILDALLMTLRPLARALLRSGIGYREFSDMAKVAFVNVAADDYGLRGRATNTSRIAVITGITRKEVKKIKDLGPGVLAEEFVQESPASVLLQFWHSDPNYTDAAGNARQLEFDQGEYSFVTLVSKYAGDIPPGAMCTELKRVGAIEELEGKQLKALKKAFFPDGAGDRLIISLGEILAASADTVAFNCDPTLVEGVGTRYITISSVDGVHERYFPEIKVHARAKLFELGENFSEYLSKLKVEEPAPKSQNSQVGIGLFYYQLGDND
jgi:hypothetical protein